MKLSQFNPLDIQNGTFYIPDNVIELDYLLFHNCYAITNIVINQRLQIIGNAAFWNCYNLEHINIPFSIKEIGFSAFENCRNLKQISLNCNLSKIESSLFLNCISLEAVDINCPIERIDHDAFRNCRSLKELSLPNSVTKIDENAFNNCLKLEKINLPINISELKDATFKNCQSLKQIDIPNKVTQLGDLSFYDCINLKYVTLSKKLGKIGDRCFEGCTSLLKIDLPNSLRIISSGAFMNSGLMEIDIPSSVIVIGKNAFSNTTLKIINFSSSLIYYDFKELESLKNLQSITIYGYNISNLNEIKEVQIKELLDNIYEKLSKNNHIYNLTRESLDKFYQSNYNFSSIVHSIIDRVTKMGADKTKELEKFDILFEHTRFINLPNKEIFESLDVNHASIYKPKIIKELSNIPIFNKTSETKKRIIDVVSVFGLFENDKDASNRLEQVKKLFEMRLFIDEENFNFISYLKVYFEKVSNQEYVLNKYTQIPIEFEDYLKTYMNKDDISELKKLDKRLGRKINDFFKENYSLQTRYYYIPKTGIDENTLTKIYNEILFSRMNNQMTIESLNNIFSEIPRIYNYKISTYLFKNFKYILANSDYQKNVKTIITKYDEIESFYLSKGNDRFNFMDASKYINNYIFSEIKIGNYQFAELVKNAGVTSQEKFERYQDLYEIIKNKRASIIPRVKEDNIINLNGNSYQISVEMLRKDDPFTMLVGEARYSNCCQVFGDNAESSMLHACGDGRIFCAYLINKDGNKELLDQSWVWRKGNFLCFDNIEFTSFAHSKKIFQNIVYECYKLACDSIINVSIQNNDKIDAIAIGCGNDDLILKNYFKESFENHIMPDNYDGYTDAKRVCYIVGSSDLINLDYKIDKRYLDERRVIQKMGNELSHIHLNKMRKIYEETKVTTDNFYDFSELNGTDIDVFLGEDWYIIYNLKNGIHIEDFKIGKPKYEEEKELQLLEIKAFIKQITDKFSYGNDILLNTNSLLSSANLDETNNILNK